MTVITNTFIKWQLSSYNVYICLPFQLKKSQEFMIFKGHIIQMIVSLFPQRNNNIRLKVSEERYCRLELCSQTLECVGVTIQKNLCATSKGSP